MRLLITAGPTREPIDAVRFISNRSSGRLGIALADAAAQAGHDVTLLLGPTAAPPDLDQRAKVLRFESAADLQRLLDERFGQCDVLVMAAAVADYRPAQVVAGKPARALDPGAPGARQTLELVPTPDLVADVAQRKQPGQKVIAFALEEPAHLEQRAQDKMRRKGVDAIVANPLGTMEASDITPHWFTATGAHESPGRMSKADFASWLLDRLTR